MKKIPIVAMTFVFRWEKPIDALTIKIVSFHIFSDLLVGVRKFLKIP